MSVYIITCKLNKRIVYVGSTNTTLKQRMVWHKNAYTKWVNGKERLSSEIHKYFKVYGVANFDMTLYKNYDYIDKKYIKAKEQLLMNKLRRYTCLTVVNKCDSFTTPYIQKLKLKLYNKKHQKKNK